ncbi:hypothetical protein CLOM_g1160 [Closterium sp. NIES-68]|nr:hypothetical protein CLOM_g1160 [Closterium sp. NIES-68]GJP65263.1 hypothetical protein CLOP_g22172 [Closterium sp. NIES-67]
MTSLPAPPATQASFLGIRLVHCAVVLVLLALAHLARVPRHHDPLEAASQASLEPPISADLAAAAFSRGLLALASWNEEAAGRSGKQWEQHESSEEGERQPHEKEQGFRGDSRITRVAAFNVDRAVIFLHQRRQKQGRELRAARFRVVPLAAPPEAGNVTWDDLYPEMNYDRSNFTCPAVPRAPWEERDETHDVADAVVAVVPCRPAKDSLARDVRWLQLMLSLARFASQSRRPWMPIVIVSSCRPPPNLFHCRFLARAQPSPFAAVNGGAEGDVWVYNVTARDMRARIQPAGSCALAQPTAHGAAVARPPSSGRPRFAFATMLHSKDDYACGAIVLAHSLRATGLALPPSLFTSAPAGSDSREAGGGAQRFEAELVALVSAEVGAESRKGLQAAGWRIVEIERIRNVWAKKRSFKEWNYSTLRLWQLTEYKRVVYMDSDIVALRPLTHLFLYPEMSAVLSIESRFNAGFMVIEPVLCTFHFLMAHIRTIVSSNGGAQNFFNNVFTWWHRLPESSNFLKLIGTPQGHPGRDQEVAAQTALFSADPPQLHAIHYLGRKPWYCFRDFDCNHLLPYMQKFVNDAAHRRWWQVHDAMDERLKPWCLLTEEQKKGLWGAMEKRRQEGADPEMWNFTVTDPRKDLALPWGVEVGGRKGGQRTWSEWLGGRNWH